MTTQELLDFIQPHLQKGLVSAGSVTFARVVNMDESKNVVRVMHGGIIVASLREGTRLTVLGIQDDPELNAVLRLAADSITRNSN